MEANNKPQRNVQQHFVTAAYLAGFTAYRRASEAPMSARAVAVIRPAPIIIALPLFLCTLSGKRQLHACRYLFARRQAGRATVRTSWLPRRHESRGFDYSAIHGRWDEFDAKILPLYGQPAVCEQVGNGRL